MRTHDTTSGQHGGHHHRAPAPPGLASGPFRLAPDTALQLQRSAGNSAVASAITIQRKTAPGLEGASTPYIKGGQITGLLNNKKVVIKMSSSAPLGWLDFD